MVLAGAVLFALTGASCSSGEVEEPRFARVDACGQLDGELASELTGVEKGTPRGTSDQQCSWRGSEERGSLELSVLPLEIEGNGVFEGLAGAGDCRRPVEIEAVDSCWRETAEGVTVLVKLEEVVVRTSWDSPSWQEKAGEQKAGLVDRIARASVRGL